MKSKKDTYEVYVDAKVDVLTEIKASSFQEAINIVKTIGTLDLLLNKKTMFNDWESEVVGVFITKK